MYTGYLLAVFAIVVLIKLIIIFYNYSKFIGKHLAFSKKLPGPPAWPIIGNALELMFFKESDILYKIENMIKNYGSIFKFWLGPQLCILVTNPKYIEILLKSSKAAQKAYLYKYIAAFAGHGLLSGSGQLRKDQRKAILPTLNASFLEENYLEKITKQCNLLMEKLKPLENGQTFNMWNKITLCTIDIVYETLLGIEGFSQEETSLPFMLSFEQSFTVATERMSKLLYQNDFLFYFTKHFKEEKTAMAIQDFFSHLVLSKKEYLKSGPNQQISIDRLLSVKNLNRDSRLKTITNLCAVSQDSSATAISFLMLMLAIHQDVQKKVHHEIDQNLDPNSDFEVKLDKLNSLKYLDLCIKETLRLYPNGPVLLREIKEDFKLSDELTIPGGSIVVIFVYGLHRNPDIWADPDKFIPERFLNSEELKRHPFSYVPFSAGPMGCIGKTFAETVMKSVSVAILRKYRIETDLKSIDEVKTKIAISIRSQNGYPVRIIPRS